MAVRHEQDNALVEIVYERFEAERLGRFPA